MPFSKNDPNINRKGRPPLDFSWAELIRRYGEGDDEEIGVPRMILVVKKLYYEAIKGNIQAIKEIFDRTDGKPGTVILEKGCSTQEFEENYFDDPRVLKTTIEVILHSMKNSGELDIQFKEDLKKFTE